MATVTAGSGSPAAPVTAPETVVPCCPYSAMGASPTNASAARTRSGTALILPLYSGGGTNARLGRRHRQNGACGTVLRCGLGGVGLAPKNGWTWVGPANAGPS